MSDLRQPRTDRRSQKRQPASGPVTLWWTDCTLRTIEGRLVNQSEAGLRVAHGCADLGPGQQVHFQHAGGKGIARTIWTRIVADCVESGLLILPDELPET